LKSGRRKEKVSFGGKEKKNVSRKADDLRRGKGREVDLVEASEVGNQGKKARSKQISPRGHFTQGTGGLEESRNKGRGQRKNIGTKRARNFPT